MWNSLRRKRREKKKKKKLDHGRAATIKDHRSGLSHVLFFGVT